MRDYFIRDPFIPEYETKEEKIKVEESKWGTCSNCINASEGVCDSCPDENGEIVGITEISDNGTCENWRERK